PLSLFLPDPSPAEIYTLSLHDALPISTPCSPAPRRRKPPREDRRLRARRGPSSRRTERSGAESGQYGGVSLIDHLPKGTADPDTDRKSTRLNSSHVKISYAVFCLKKKK